MFAAGLWMRRRRDGTDARAVGVRAGGAGVCVAAIKGNAAWRAALKKERAIGCGCRAIGCGYSTVGNVAAGDSGSYSIERKRAGVWVCSWLLQRDVGVLRRIQFLKKVGPRIVQVRFLLRLSCDDMPAIFHFVK